MTNKQIPQALLNKIGSVHYGYIITAIFYKKKNTYEVRGISESEIAYATKEKIEEWKEASIKLGNGEFAFMTGETIGQFKS